MTHTENSSEPQLLSVRNLRTQFHTARGMARAVDGVSFDLSAGETLGIVGESGSGKSVLVRTIMNLLPANAVVPDTGRVLYRGKEVRAMSAYEAKHFWGPEMAMIFQDPMTALNPVKKIGEQLTESMRFHLDLSSRVAVARALDLLGEVGIPEPGRRLGQYPHELSGGLRQRVVIAIALACEPRLLIADEPTTALDVTVQRQILDLLAKLQRAHGMAMILITHDMGVVSGMADKVSVMYAGQFVESAPSQQLFTAMHHPYTDALLASIPHLEMPSHTRLNVIEGRPPDMVEVPPGCRFRPRCRHARPDCGDDVPALVAGETPEHLYRCFYPLRTVTASPVSTGPSRAETDPADEGSTVAWQG